MNSYGYIRIAPDEAEAELEAQRHQVRTMASLRDVRLTEVVEDVHEGDSLDRPGWQRISDAKDAGALDAVFVTTLDRLTTSVVDLNRIFESFRAEPLGACPRLVVGYDILDTDSSTGWLTANIVTTLAEWERRRAAERSRDMMEAEAQRQAGAGTVIYGYMRAQDGRLVSNPVEQQVLDIIERQREHASASWGDIARLLNERKYTTRRGNLWSRQGVAQLYQRHIQPRLMEESR